MIGFLNQWISGADCGTRVDLAHGLRSGIGERAGCSGSAGRVPQDVVRNLIYGIHFRQPRRAAHGQFQRVGVEVDLHVGLRAVLVPAVLLAPTRPGQPPVGTGAAYGPKHATQVNTLCGPMGCTGEGSAQPSSGCESAGPLSHWTDSAMGAETRSPWRRSAGFPRPGLGQLRQM